MQFSKVFLYPPSLNDVKNFSLPFPPCFLLLSMASFSFSQEHLRALTVAAGLEELFFANMTARIDEAIAKAKRDLNSEEVVDMEIEDIS
jgi:hypothetical protein